MQIHHVALRTRDLPRLLSFYRDLLGLRVLTDHAPRSVWLETGGAILMLERAAPGEPEPTPGTMDTLAFTIEPSAREPARARLRAAGVPVEHESDFTLYFRDPDGRRVGLSHHPHAWEDAREDPAKSER